MSENQQQAQQQQQPIPSMPFDDMYAGRFVKAGNLHGKPRTWTVVSFQREQLEGEKGAKPAAVFVFKETYKGVPVQIVLSKLNAQCVRAMFGSDLALWVGKRITFFPTAEYAPIKRGQECLRVAGSPDIDREIVVTIKLPKRKAFDMVMRPTANGKAPTAGGPQPPPKPAPALAPASDTSDAEPPPDDDDFAAADDLAGRM